MKYCINNMVQEFPEELNIKEKTSYNDSLFKVSIKSPMLDAEKAKSFHSFMIKKIFLVKRARSDLKSSLHFYQQGLRVL